MKFQIAETGLGYLQRAFDITAADLIKGGLLGVPSYVEYRKLCSGKEYKSFKDLVKNDDMEPEVIIKLNNFITYIPEQA